MNPHTDLDPAVIRVIAERALREERIRAAVETEKARLRTQRSLWSRLTAWLPFTITINWKTK